ncbi:hypothetical protein P255_01427 [Acinetobacter brisouii CIP 110357]|uniref:Uncharacterized protein n=2 Tax=Acinetobacter brisouii TaxID=396323 RepID=V2U949_9GAMM|nr:hypothetical protein [Acinetobacter brisouii]ENV46047.1 hypothetical protein F954_02873 [Acinetobacter brisouii ANC 4119]ESK50928.1 hypothetical protein P255_01427 [Acinetobacter brisouii CIP 110357]
MIKTPSSIVLGGAGIFKKGMTQLGGVANLNLIIKQLFANSEQGFTQTLDDYSILFQDAAGTTALTGAGQTLGLVLDKSKGLVLGSELVTNGGFTTDTSWSKGTGWSIANGFATHTSGTPSTLTQPVSVTTGRAYQIEFDVSNTSSGNIAACFTGGTTVAGTLSGANGHRKVILFAVTGNVNFGVTCDTLFNGSITNLTCKLLNGNHASQPTSSYRPLLQNTPRRIQYDGIDDKLTTTLPAQLTGCTVIRAIPNVGCQILTNQTIPTPYNDSTSHCGLIVINRALTAYETSLVTQIFNKLAGV